MAKPNLKLAPARDPSREALAAAIADETTARKNLEDARAAAGKAEEHVWSAADKVAALREDAEKASQAGAIIASLAAGAVDIADLDRPRAETLAKIDAAEQELAAWRRAREAAEAEIAPRENSHDWARRHLKDAVAEVVRTADIDAMLASAERARDVLLAERCALMQVRDALPLFSPECKAVEAFLSHPFLLHEHGDEWRDHPVVAPWRDVVDALHLDADAPLPAMQTEATVVILPSNGRS